VFGVILADPRRNNGDPLQDFLEAIQDLILRELRHRNHAGWVLGTNILEAVLFPLHKRLNLVMEVTGNNPETGQSLLLQGADLI
jgi:hypothetical protein